MKQFFIPVILGLLLLVGCGEADVLPTEVPVTHLPTTIPTADLPTATATTLPPTSTPTEELPTPVSMPPPLFTSTPTQTPAVTPEPTGTAVVPEGYLLFFWDTETPVEYPAYYSIPVSDPQQELYIAIPDKSFDDWQLSPILSGQLNWPDEYTSWPTSATSPDQTQLAFTLYKHIDADSYTVSIHIADFNKGTLTQITEDYNAEIYNISWFPDNQTIAYSLGNAGFLASTDDVAGTQFTPDFSSDVRTLAVSPNGQFIAIILETGGSLTGNLLFYDLNSEEMFPVSVNSQFNPNTAIWSSGNNWFASNVVSSGGLVVFNAQTQKLITLSSLNDFSLPSWSPVAPQLVFVEGDRVNTNLYLWDPISQDTRMIANLGSYLDAPIWSPQGRYLAVAFVKDEMIDLLSIDTEIDEVNTVTHFDDVKQFKILSWSPDGAWILVFWAQENKSCLYIVNHKNGEGYCAVNSTGMINPDAVYWLPNQPYLP